MLIIPVLDILQGVIVRGVAGQRATYRPLETQLTPNVTARELTKLFIEKFHLNTVYVADLDSILHDRPNFPLYEEVQRTGAKFWLDAGVHSHDLAAQLLNRCAQRQIFPTLIFGLESLQSPAALGPLGAFAQQHQGIFSLDLQADRPLTKIPAWQELKPLEIVHKIVEAGFERLILLDLAAVGMLQGSNTLQLLKTVLEEFPELELITGGGVRHLHDLYVLREAGCTAALVSSALHNGSITAELLQEFRND